MTSSSARTAIIGLGPVGVGILSAALEDPRLDVVTCVDPRSDRAQIASDAGFRAESFADIADVEELGDVAIIAATSDAAATIAIAQPILERGVSVVTTCESMICARPEDAETDLAALDALARENGAAFLATGVNPGFVMDLLPVMCGVATRAVAAIELTRRVNVATRRERLQEKVGVGITNDEFQLRHAEGRIGHVGLRESVLAVGYAYGWLGTVDETIAPVLDANGERSLGVRHEASFTDDEGRTRVKALLEMYAGAPDEDRILIHGVPTIEAHFPGGVSGDQATVSAVLNAAAVARDLPGGVLGLSAIAPPHWTERLL